MPITDLFPKCPQWLNDISFARDYETPDYRRCNNCEGEGMYEAEDGSIRVCETYRAWREQHDT